VVGIVIGIMVGPARHLPARALQWQAGRSRSGEAGGMSCSIGGTYNDWFAFLFTPATLPKTVRPKHGG